MAGKNASAAWVNAPGLADENVTLDSHLPPALKVTYYALGGPLAAALVATNAILMAAIAKSSNLGTKLNMVVCNMAAADLLLGAALLLNLGLLEQHPGPADSQHPALCTFVAVLELMPFMASSLFLSLVHLDRFLAVCVPTIYPDTWTERRVTALCTAVWLAVAVLGALAYAFPGETGVLVCDVLALPRSYLLMVMVLHMFPTTAVNIALFLKIKHELKVHQRKIQVTNTLTYSNLLDDTQLARLYFLLVLMCFLAWMPFLVCICIWHGGAFESHMAIITRVTFLLGHVAGIKLIVYVCQSNAYRSAVRKRLRRQSQGGSMHNVRGSSGVQ